MAWFSTWALVVCKRRFFVVLFVCENCLLGLVLVVFSDKRKCGAELAVA